MNHPNPSPIGVGGNEVWVRVMLLFSRLAKHPTYIMVSGIYRIYFECSISVKRENRYKRKADLFFFVELAFKEENINKI